MDDDISLGALFNRGFCQYYKQFRDVGELDGFSIAGARDEEDAATLENLTELTKLFHHVAFCVERVALFSPNEELDDINTKDMIFLSVPFILAELKSNGLIVKHRIAAIESAIVYWHEFLYFMDKLGFLSKDERSRLHNDENTYTDINRREIKLERFRRTRDLNKEMVMFVKHKAKALCGDAYTWGADSVDEELDRKIALLFLKRSVAESFDHLELAKQELHFLKMAPEQRSSSSSNTGPPKKPFIVKINDPTELRNEYLNKVFKPFHEFPTITLAEVAAWEMEVEVKQLGAKERVAQKKKQAHDAAEAEGLEASDNEEEELDEEQVREKYCVMCGMVVQKEIKARKWDDWKDENPKGSGNKKCNVG